LGRACRLYCRLARRIALDSPPVIAGKVGCRPWFSIES
jgi:hypothetical protein